MTSKERDSRMLIPPTASFLREREAEVKEVKRAACRTVRLKSAAST